MYFLTIRRAAFLVTAAVFCTFGRADAGTVYTWTGLAGNTLWTESDNWNPDLIWPSGAGVIQSDAPGGLPAILKNLSIEGHLYAPSGSFLQFLGKIDNKAGSKISLGTGTSGAGRLMIEDDVLLSGGGSVEMSNHVGNMILATGDDAHLVLDADNTILGSGSIGNEMVG